VTCVLALRAQGYICAAINHIYRGQEVAGISSLDNPPFPLVRSAVVVSGFDLISTFVVFVSVHASHECKMLLHITLSITASSASTSLIPPIAQAIVLLYNHSLLAPLLSLSSPLTIL
jgi:hypothetical protein